jgi:flagellar basal body P-ring protein FlgI
MVLKNKSVKLNPETIKLLNKVKALIMLNYPGAKATDSNTIHLSLLRLYKNTKFFSKLKSIVIEQNKNSIEE